MGHGQVEPFLKGPPLQLGQRAGRGVSNLLKSLLSRRFRMGAHPPEAVYQQVPRDREEPGPEGGGGAVVLAVSEYPEEGLLEQILSSRAVARSEERRVGKECRL